MNNPLQALFDLDALAVDGANFAPRDVAYTDPAVGYLVRRSGDGTQWQVNTSVSGREVRFTAAPARLPEPQTFALVLLALGAAAAVQRRRPSTGGIWRRPPEANQNP